MALKITDALYPDDGIDDEGWSFNHGCCWIKYEQEIEQAAHNGTLPVKDPLTRGPLAFMRGNAWKLGVVAIDDLRAYVADRGITVTVEAAPESQATTPSPAPVVGSASNSQARARRDLLTPVIEAAQNECGVQFDVPAVWASMVRMADAGKRPLLGVSDDGIKWQDSNDEPQFLNIKNLRDRLSRSKKKAR